MRGDLCSEQWLVANHLAHEPQLSLPLSELGKFFSGHNHADSPVAVIMSARSRYCLHAELSRCQSVAQARDILQLTSEVPAASLHYKHRHHLHLDTRAQRCSFIHRPENPMQIRQFPNRTSADRQAPSLGILPPPSDPRKTLHCSGLRRPVKQLQLQPVLGSSPFWGQRVATAE
jgi:hypothetical protein